MLYTPSQKNDKTTNPFSFGITLELGIETIQQQRNIHNKQV